MSPALGVAQLFNLDGPPVDGTDEVEQLSFDGTPDGGTFRLQHAGWDTTDLAWDADDATIQAALEALVGIGTGNVTLTGGLITFGGSLIRSRQPLVVSDNSLTGTDAVPVLTVVTAGTAPVPQNPAKGAVAVDNVAGALYVNLGTSAQPAWAGAV